MTAEQRPTSQGTSRSGRRSPPDLAVVRAEQPSNEPPADSRESGAGGVCSDGGIDPTVATGWVRRAVEGDQDAFRQLVEAFQGRVFRVVVHVLRCDRTRAEDCCQEVFLRVFRGLADFDGSDRVGAWIHTIATNVAISEYRKDRALKRNRRTFSLDAPVAGSEDLTMDPPGKERRPEEVVHHSQFAARVRECVDQLPDEFRLAVVLRDLQGLSYEEIGESLGIAPGTVRSRIHRGRVLLQQMLKGFEP